MDEAAIRAALQATFPDGYEPTVKVLVSPSGRHAIAYEFTKHSGGCSLWSAPSTLVAEQTAFTVQDLQSNGVSGADAQELFTALEENQ